MAKDWPSSFPPWRSRRRKVKGEREEIWSEEEEEPAGPPFFPLLSLLPSLCPPRPLCFFPRCLSWRKWQVRVEQEVRRLCLARRNVRLPQPKERARAHVRSRGGRARLPPGTFTHPCFWYRRFISDGCACRSGAGRKKRLNGLCSEGRNVCIFLASRRKPCNNSRCAALWSPSLSCSLCFYF